MLERKGIDSNKQIDTQDVIKPLQELSLREISFEK